MKPSHFTLNRSALGLVSGSAILLSSVVPMLAQGTVAGPTTAASGEEDIHDIRGPIHLAMGWEWLLWVLVALVVAGIIWWWVRRRPPVRVKTAHELALERLQRARALMQPEKAREFSIEVSVIARGYIEQRFQVWAARRTTEEFLYDLVSSSDSRLTDNRPLLADFLRHCDLAKFAGWSLSDAEMDSMYRCVEIFIRQTAEDPLKKPATAEKTSEATPV